MTDALRFRGRWKNPRILVKLTRGKNSFLTPNLATLLSMWARPTSEASEREFSVPSQSIILPHQAFRLQLLPSLTHQRKETKKKTKTKPNNTHTRTSELIKRNKIPFLTPTQSVIFQIQASFQISKMLFHTFSKHSIDSLSTSSFYSTAPFTILIA